MNNFVENFGTIENKDIHIRTYCAGLYRQHFVRIYKSNKFIRINFTSYFNKNKKRRALTNFK